MNRNQLLIACLASFGYFLLWDVAIVTAQPKVTWEWVGSSSSDVLAIEAVLEQLEQPAPCLKGSRRLRDVFQSLPISTRIDKEALEEENITPDEMIQSDSYGQQTIRMYLNSILTPLQLTWKPETGYITITSKTSSSHFLCMYDITDIVMTKVRSKNEKKEIGDRFNLLASAIEGTIQPDTWECAGGNSSFVPWKVGDRYMMLVTSDFETQFAIQSLFETEGRLSAKHQVDARVKRITPDKKIANTDSKFKTVHWHEGGSTQVRFSSLRNGNAP